MDKKKKDKFFNPELRLTKDEDAERKKLVRKLDKVLATGLRTKREEAECWVELRPLYSKPGCKSQWGKFVTSKGGSLSTVNGLIKRLNDGWEESVRKPSKLSNRPNSGQFTGPGLEFTGKPFLNKKEIASGVAGKEILEAAFLLTPDEKEQFLEALRIIEPEKALSIMLAAVLDYRESMSGPLADFPPDDSRMSLGAEEPL
jgi:hypothetical protein